MKGNERSGEFEVPEDLVEALQKNPEAVAIWDELPVAHRRGHVIAIERITDAEARAERIEAHHRASLREARILGGAPTSRTSHRG